MYTETSLITQKLKERIIGILEARYRQTGTNDAVSWRGIWIVFGITEEDFCEALNAALADPRPAIVFTDSDHIKLNLKARSDVRVTAESAKAVHAEALTARFLRIFGFGKRNMPEDGTHLKSTPSST